MIQSKPIIFAALLNVIFVMVIPRIITKPTNIRIIDDIVIFLNMHKGSLFTSTVYACLLVLAIEYAMQHTEGIQSPLSGPMSASMSGLATSASP